MSITIENLLIQTNFNITHIEFKYNDKLPDNLTIQQCGGMGIIASDLNNNNSCMFSFESLTTNKQILKILIDLDSFYVDPLPADFEKSPRLKSHEIAKIIYDMIVLNNSKGMALQIITIGALLNDNNFNIEHILWKQNCEIPTDLIFAQYFIEPDGNIKKYDRNSSGLYNNISIGVFHKYPDNNSLLNIETICKNQKILNIEILLDSFYDYVYTIDNSGKMQINKLKNTSQSKIAEQIYDLIVRYNHKSLEFLFMIPEKQSDEKSISKYQEWIGFCSMNNPDYNILLYNYEYDSCEIIIKHFSNKLYKLRVFNQDCKIINDYLLCDIKDKNDIIAIDEKYDILILNINGHKFDLQSNIGYYLHYKIELSYSEKTLVLIKITNLITDIDYIFEGNCEEQNTEITCDYFVDLINDDRIELIKLNFNVYDDYLLVSNEKQQIFQFNKKISFEICPPSKITNFIINSDNYVKLRIHLHDYYITYDILYDENDVSVDIEIDKDYSNNHNRLLYILDKQIGYIEDGEFYTDKRISKKLVLFIISQTTNIEVKCLNI